MYLHGCCYRLSGSCKSRPSLFTSLNKFTGCLYWRAMDHCVPIRVNQGLIGLISINLFYLFFLNQCFFSLVSWRNRILAGPSCRSESWHAAYGTVGVGNCHHRQQPTTCSVYPNYHLPLTSNTLCPRSPCSMYDAANPSVPESLQGNRCQSAFPSCGPAKPCCSL